MYGRGGPAPGETVLDRYVVERRCLWCPRRVKPQPAMWPGLVSRSHNAKPRSHTRRRHPAGVTVALMKLGATGRSSDDMEPADH